MSENNEVLVVMSKVKAYIKAAGFNTAGSVGAALSDKVRAIVDEAMENAKNSKRKTVKDTDIA